MKKYSFYILIALIFTNIFVPFGLVLDSEVKVEKSIVEAAECEILSAIWIPAGEQGNTWYKEQKTPADIQVKSKNCVDVEGVTLTVFEEDTCGINCDDGLSDSGLQRREIIIPTDNFRMRISLGEEECEISPGSNDCHLFFYIRQNNEVLYNSWSDKTNGRLLYECDTVCNENGRYLKTIAEGTDTNPIYAEAQKELVSTDDTYTLLAPIGELKEVKSSGGVCATNKDIPNGIGCYLNTIFLIAIGLCGALAVIMIVVAGIQYMGDESVFGKTEAKSKITSAILGLFIALGAYLILNTINPDLTGKNGVNVSTADIKLQAIENIPTKTYETITGKRTLSASEYDVIGRKVAKEVGIPFCAIKVILERESKGNPGAIGFDENVRNTAIPSRIAFVNSGKKYSGETFTPSQDLITKSGFVNQNKNSVTNTPGLGLDWRFSKGLGLTQITLFPPGYFTSNYKTNPPGLDKKDNYPTLNGFTPKDLLDPEKNLKAGATVWKDFWIRCDKKIYNTWSAYGSGSCNGSSDFIKKEATARTEYYNSCSTADKSI